MVSPGRRSGGKIPGGMPTRVMTDVAHVCARTSYSWVVDAFVTSAPACPVSQRASKSGIISRVRAAASCGVPAEAASWKIVLSGSCWIPVIAYSSAAGTWRSTRPGTPSVRVSR